MKKIFQIDVSNKNRDRQSDSIKNEIRKYIKREKSKKLPDDMNFWHFDCKFGKDENDAQEISFADIIKKVDFANKNGFESFYLEIIAVAVFKEKKVSNSTLEDENSLED